MDDGYTVLQVRELAVYQRVQLLDRSIRSPVIHKDELDIAVGLAQHRFRTLLDVALYLIDGNYDAYFHFS